MTSHHFLHLGLHSDMNTEFCNAYSTKYLSPVSNTNEVANGNAEDSLADMLDL